MRKLLIAVGIIGALLGLAVIGMTVYTVDLRPEALRGGEVSAERTAEGRAWLDRAIVAHGGAEAFRRHRDARATGELAFVTFMGRNMVNVFPQDQQRFELDALLGTDDARLKLVGGPADGEVWGMQHNIAYRIAPGGALEAYPADATDADVRFWPPTMAYFMYMPWRIAEAPVVQYVGEQTVAGVDCAVVFATWGGLEPDRSVDQYLMFIDKQTHLARWSQFTVRDLGGFMAGAVELTDHRAVGDLTLPHLIRSLGEPGAADTFSHEIRVEAYALATGRPDAHYRPRPGLRGDKALAR